MCIPFPFPSGCESADGGSGGHRVRAAEDLGHVWIPGHRAGEFDGKVNNLVRSQVRMFQIVVTNCLQGSQQGLKNLPEDGPHSC